MGCSPKEQAKFRRELVAKLAYETPFARSVAMRGIPEGLTESLGVTEAVLKDAAELVRSGYRVDAVAEPAVVLLDMYVQEPLGSELVRLAKTNRMRRGQLAKALLHAAMQTAREPAQRVPRQWSVLGKEKEKKIGRKKVKVGEIRRVHLEIEVSRGLARAIGRRAAAYGAGRSRYILLWLADLVDGLLGDLLLVPVETGQMFDQETAYVLPAVVGGEDSGGVLALADTNVADDRDSEAPARRDEDPAEALPGVGASAGEAPLRSGI